MFLDVIHVCVTTMPSKWLLFDSYSILIVCCFEEYVVSWFYIVFGILTDVSLTWLIIWLVVGLCRKVSMFCSVRLRLLKPINQALFSIQYSSSWRCEVFENTLGSLSNFTRLVSSMCSFETVSVLVEGFKVCNWPQIYSNHIFHRECRKPAWCISSPTTRTD